MGGTNDEQGKSVIHISFTFHIKTNANSHSYISFTEYKPF
ncbi:hypothetical protein CUS_5757 [Ruminococcus albus 8]|uniref:Uncharacterized protein n=1 Tax=Ruminococcus albus 8 TaxID=246199 RepID=E9SEJ8_RUMAL|nr:hypothetical protein CUS_5757 [Ruminococcus albus 8]